MAEHSALRPRGFGGCRDSWQDILPAGDTLKLPEQAIAEGPFRRLPEGAFGSILVQGLAESLGNLDGLMAALAGRLTPDGLLLLDFENLNAPRSLRFAIEGRPGSLDPIGSLHDPERRLHKSRVIESVQDAGMSIVDLFEVPSPADEVGPEFARQLFRNGFVPVSYVGQTPPARFWLLASGRRPIDGTVLIGPGARLAVETTQAALAAFLPAGWEVVVADPSSSDQRDNEAARFDELVPRSRGELLWFLRAGSRPDAVLFEQLCARTILSPAAPERRLVESPADLDGLMLARTDMFRVGPFSKSPFVTSQIVYEDWTMRLQAATHAVHGVGGSLSSVPLRETASADVFEREANAMLSRWQALQQDPSGFRSADNPLARRVEAQDTIWSGRRPRVSLCMIARNEERFLDACLASAAGIADEIICVDTGSSDRTIQIAERHGARVLHFDWIDDFAAARNYAMQAATGDWILSLDADEVLEPDAAAKIRKLIEDPGISGYHLHFRNLYTTKKTLGVLMVRLFRNLPGVVWENCIHEQITPSLVQVGKKSGLVLSTSDVEVDHHGYLDEVMASRDKNVRNDVLFRKHLESAPDDVYMLYKYGDFIRRFPGRTIEARDYLGRAMDLILRMPPAAARGIPYAAEIAALIVLELARTNELDAARALLEQAFRRFTPTPNLHYLAASVALNRHENDVAIRHYRQCLSYRDQVLVVPIQDGVTSYVAITGIAQAELQKGNHGVARRLLEQAIQAEPNYEVATLVLSRLLFETGDYAPAIDVLMRFLTANPDAAGVSQQACLFLGQLGMKEQARRLGEHAVMLLERQSLDVEANRLRGNLVALIA